jgi:hypothetical protein
VKLADYSGGIDFLDIVEINKMKLVNESAVMSSNNFVKEAYKFNLFIQVVLTTINGVTLRQTKKN